MNKRLTSFAAVASLALLASSAHATQLFGSFENTVNSSLSSATPFTFSGAVLTLNPTPTYSATNATDGAASLQLKVPLSFVFGITVTEGSGTTAMKDAMNSNDRLLFDVLVPQINDAAGAPDTDGYVVFLPAINSDGTGGGFKQSPGNLTVVNTANQNAYNAGPVTFAWDYRSQGILFPADAPNPTPPPFGFTQFNLSTNAGNLDSAPIMYIDNLRFVTIPEPASVASIAGLMLVGVRRRK